MTEPNSSDLAPLHALVTGGGSGIGLAAAARLLARGAVVTLMGRDGDRLERAASSLVSDLGLPSTRIRTSTGDVADEQAVAHAIEVAAEGGRLDVAVANAGAGGAAPLTRTTVDSWRSILDTNLTGAFLTVKHAGIAMAADGYGGAICAVSSIAGSATHRYMTPYCVSKAGLEMLVANAADEFGANGIRVNAVAPGLVETSLSDTLRTTEPVYDDYVANMPLVRHGRPDDVAAAIDWLVGPDSTWITGVILPVDGGHHLRRGPNLEPIMQMVFSQEAMANQPERE